MNHYTCIKSHLVGDATQLCTGIKNMSYVIPSDINAKYYISQCQCDDLFTCVFKVAIFPRASKDM